jgi:hypothetical protein
MKKLIAIIWLGVLFTCIAALFWYNEWVYQLPTPVPENYKPVATGQHISLNGLNADKDKPVFLHFFNPDCPCSRFNITQFRSLVKEYQDRVSFTVVVMNNDQYTEKQVQEKFGIDLPVSFDTSIATTCGVYSTPQAVILNKNHQLYYRGNYNKSRYCTDKKTNYAEIALNALLEQKGYMSFDRYALKAYGCQLPKCTNN